ncbi:MAG: hypothetical protein WCW46_03530 [Candidatus Paceibacterota bacterium]
MIEQKIQNLREQIAIWDNPTASSEEKGKVLAALVGNDPSFWGSVAKLATSPAKKVIKTISPMEVVMAEAASVKPTPVLATTPAPKPVLAKPAPATVAPRTLKLNAGGSGDFATKLNGVAKEIGLEDHSVLGRWRKAMTEETKGWQAWKACREINGMALAEKVIKTDSDWKLLVSKMKKNIFFSDANGVENFIGQCPKEVMIDLLIGEGGLAAFVKRANEEIDHPAAPARIAFVIDMCTLVGSPANDLMLYAKSVVNRMRQLGVLSADHWLVQKIEAMKVAKQAAKRKELAEKAQQQAKQAEPKVEEAKIEVSAEKPETLGSSDAEFAQQMMVAAGEIDTMSEVELEKLTAPTTVN